MELPECASKSSSGGDTKVVEDHVPLIHGLPDDLALLCLARVPRRYHHQLKAVCRRWNMLVSSDVWYSCRQRLQIAETWIYALCRDSLDHVCMYALDPDQRSWKRLPDVPIQCMKRYGMACEVLGHKLFLLGGCCGTEDATDEVYSYDALTGKWETCTPLITARCHFVCEALNGCLYAIGGMSLASESLYSWEVYDPLRKSWTCHYDNNIPQDIGESVNLHGRIYVRHVSPDVFPNTYAATYCPSSGSWHTVDNEMVMRWRGPAVLNRETLFVLDQISGTKLMMWDKESHSWMLVGKLSALYPRPPCRLASVANKIYITGKGLQTIVLNPETAGNIRGIMMSNSIPGLANSDDLVVFCKTIAM